MFESGRFSESRVDGQRLIITVFVIIVLVLSILYYIIVIIVDILAVLKPSALEGCLFTLCRKKSQKDEKPRGGKVKRNSTFGVMNPMRAAGAVGGAGAATAGAAGVKKGVTPTAAPMANTKAGRAAARAAAEAEAKAKAEADAAAAAAAAAAEVEAAAKGAADGGRGGAGVADNKADGGGASPAAAPQASKPNALMLSSNPLFASAKPADAVLTDADLVPDKLPSMPPPDSLYQQYLQALQARTEEMNSLTVDAHQDRIAPGAALVMKSFGRGRINAVTVKRSGKGVSP
jgi:hypothetical protein